MLIHKKTIWKISDYSKITQSNPNGCIVCPKITSWPLDYQTNVSSPLLTEKNNTFFFTERIFVRQTTLTHSLSSISRERENSSKFVF